MMGQIPRRARMRAAAESAVTTRSSAFHEAAGNMTLHADNSNDSPIKRLTVNNVSNAQKTTAMLRDAGYRVHEGSHFGECSEATGCPKPVGGDAAFHESNFHSVFKNRKPGPWPEPEH